MVRMNHADGVLTGLPIAHVRTARISSIAACGTGPRLKAMGDETLKKGGEQNADENIQSGSRRGTLDSESSRSASADGRIVWAPHQLMTMDQAFECIESDSRVTEPPSRPGESGPAMN